MTGRIEMTVAQLTPNCRATSAYESLSDLNRRLSSSRLLLICSRVNVAGFHIILLL